MLWAVIHFPSSVPTHYRIYLDLLASELSQLFCMLGELPSCWRRAEERGESVLGVLRPGIRSGRGTGNGEGAPRGDEMGRVGRLDLPAAPVGLRTEFIEDPVRVVLSRVRTPQCFEAWFFLGPVALGKPLLTRFLSWGFLTDSRTSGMVG